MGHHAYVRIDDEYFFVHSGTQSNLQKKINFILNFNQTDWPILEGVFPRLGHSSYF